MRFWHTARTLAISPRAQDFKITLHSRPEHIRALLYSRLFYIILYICTKETLSANTHTHTHIFIPQVNKGEMIAHGIIPHDRILYYKLPYLSTLCCACVAVALLRRSAKGQINSLREQRGDFLYLNF